MESPVANVERAAHLVGLRLEPTLARLDLTQGEAHVLTHLVEHGATPIGALHRRFGHKRSTLTNIVDRLEQRRLVRRELNPSDRRSFVVSLTPAGRRIGREVARARKALERALVARVAARDLAGVEAVVGTLDAL
jgi:DNA-binding MarR family transcriptional regulator